jgi:ketosteroid isomerase-like protein
MRALRWITFILFALTAGCGTANPPVDKAADEQSIRNLAVQWSAAVEKKDLDAIMAFYAPTATAVWPDAPAAHGLEAIRTAWVDLLKTPGLVLRFTPERIDVANAGDLAVDFGKVESEFDGPGGRVQDVAKYLLMWQKVDGQWKALYDSFNSNKPAAPATPTPPAGS